MTRTRTGFVALVAVLAALPAGTAAAAGTVFVEGDTLVVAGTSGVDDNTITEAGLTDDGSTFEADISGNGVLTPGNGCEEFGSTNRVICRRPASSPLTSYRMDGGTGDDKLEGPGGHPLAGAIFGGPGRDELAGGGGVDVLDGGEGDDTILGDEGGPFAGSDAPKGADDVRGGPGIDEFSYYGHRAAAVVASLDDVANDGELGERDNIHSDVENFEGDFRSDGGTNTFTGSDAANEFTGGSLADVFAGGGGNDRLLTFGGNDSLDGGAGDDYLEAGFGDDRLEGGPGLDSFLGDVAATNQMGTGNDTISARDGIAEPISCGPGADRATVDANDTVAADGQSLCETIDRAAPPPPSPGPPGPPGPPGGGGGGTTPVAFPLTIAGSTLKASKSGRISIRLTCKVSDAAGCNGRLRLASAKKVRIGGRSRTLSLGTKSFTIPPGKSARVSFKLSKANRSALRRLKKVRMTATATEQAAVARSVKRSLTLRR